MICLTAHGIPQIHLVTKSIVPWNRQEYENQKQYLTGFVWDIYEELNEFVSFPWQPFISHTLNTWELHKRPLVGILNYCFPTKYKMLMLKDVAYELEKSLKNYMGFGVPCFDCWNGDVIKWKHFPRYWPFVRGIHRWITLTKASDRELWCFLWSAPEKIAWVNNRNARRWFETPSHTLWRHCNSATWRLRPEVEIVQDAMNCMNYLGIILTSNFW